MSAEEKLKKCLKEGEKGGERHKGIKKINLSQERSSNHLKKAVHNLRAMTLFKEAGCSDWSASAGFYALYHLLLAIIAKEGYESRNQTCTFALVEQMIEENKISLTKEELKEIFDQDVTTDLEHSDKILDLREKYQYSTKTIIEEEEFLELKLRVKQLFDKLRNELERD